MQVRHKRMREITCPGVVQFVDVLSERLCVGYPSSFALYNIQGESAAPLALISADDASLSFVLSTPVDALLAVEVGWLLLFLC